MKKLSLAIVAMAAMALLSSRASTANAQGGFGWYVGSPVYSTGYSTNYGYPRYYPTTVNYGGYNDYHHDHAWHDTSHLHYRPTTIRPHGNHYHVVPGHYEVHETGHWDHMHW